MSDNSLLNSNTDYTFNIIGTTDTNGLFTTIGTSDTVTINPNTYLTYDNYNSGWKPIKALENLTYSSVFSINDVNKRYLLENNIKKVQKNKIYFNCDFEGNRIQPYELIMKLIEDEEKFSVNFKISDILTICYTNFQFIEIENNLNFNDNCDFSVLKVKFKYDKVLYENKKLTQKELRTDKIKKIMKA